MAEIFAPKGFTIPLKDVPFIHAPPYKAQWVQWAGHAMAFESAPAGWPADPDSDVLWDGLPESRCQCAHYGYVTKGRALMRLSDGSEHMLNAGDVYYCPPGHRVYSLDGFENIEFNPDLDAALGAMAAFERNSRRAEGS
jgi:hypothetical protein